MFSQRASMRRSCLLSTSECPEISIHHPAFRVTPTSVEGRVASTGESSISCEGTSASARGPEADVSVQVGPPPRGRMTIGHTDSAAHLEVEQKVTGRRGDVASQSQPPRQPFVEELASVHVQGRGDDKAQFVDHALFE